MLSRGVRERGDAFAAASPLWDLCESLDREAAVFVAGRPETHRPINVTAGGEGRLTANDGLGKARSDREHGQEAFRRQFELQDQRRRSAYAVQPGGHV